MLPRQFIRKFNLNTAVLLSEIYSEYTYWRDRNELQPGGWFYSTIENIYNNTGLSKHQQLTACKELETYGVIKVRYYGMPKKRYFKLVTSKLTELYYDFLSNQDSDADDLVEEEPLDTIEHIHPKFEGFCFQSVEQF